MGNVVELKKQKPPMEPARLVKLEYCWECGCGCQQFILLRGGEVVCYDCEMTCTRVRHFDTTQPPDKAS